MTSPYVILVSFFLLCEPLLCGVLVGLQLLIDQQPNAIKRRGKAKSRDVITKSLIYSVYVSAFVCGTIGYTLHWSPNAWCSKFGFPICFGFLGLSKACLNAFFLRRAYLAQGLMSAQRRFWYTRIGPVYLATYWLTYVTTAAIVFRGRITDINNPKELSSCQFAEYSVHFIWGATVVDVFNCVVALYLFVTPLVKVIRYIHTNHPQRENRELVNDNSKNQNEKNNKNNKNNNSDTHTDIDTGIGIDGSSTGTARIDRSDTVTLAQANMKNMKKMKSSGGGASASDFRNTKAYMRVLQWNVALSFAASVSSFLCLLYIAFGSGYMVWAFCLGDPLINSLCTFCILGSNRRYMTAVYYRCRRKCHTSCNTNRYRNTANKSGTINSNSSRSETHPDPDPDPTNEMDTDTVTIITGNVQLELSANTSDKDKNQVIP